MCYVWDRAVQQEFILIELIEFICFLRSTKLQLKQNINGIQRIQYKVNNKN